VGDALSPDRVTKRLNDVILSDDIFPTLWSPLTVKSLCHFQSSLIKEMLLQTIGIIPCSTNISAHELKPDASLADAIPRRKKLTDSRFYKKGRML
jgi:hypothetical protein